MIKATAPAKLNLVLEVLGKRSDGYHEIRSLIHTINLCDVLSFEPYDLISLESSEPALQIPDNLIIRAAELLKKTYNFKSGVKISLKKQIPWSAGLGGGSSDAATTLLVLNKLWTLQLETIDLVNLAIKLGSDIPFFLYGNAAIIEGKGEKVTPLPALSPNWFLILMPPLTVPDKTKQAYLRVNTQYYTDGTFCRRATETWSESDKIDPSSLFNVFDRIAFEIYPGLKGYWESLEKAGVANIHLAGSGPALFAPVEDEKDGNELCRHLNERGFIGYTVSTRVHNMLN
jgi:4-diphosphocytidyl-2-C-methyl-D-erythritol kinase